MSTAMIAMTTSNSISVKPRDNRRESGRDPWDGDPLKRGAIGDTYDRRGRERT